MHCSKYLRFLVTALVLTASLIVLGGCTHPVPVQNTPNGNDQNVVGLWKVTSLIDENGKDIAGDNSNITFSMTDEGKGILLMDNKPFGSDMTWSINDGSVELSLPGEKGVLATMEGDTMSFSDNGISMICQKLK